jgi:cell division protein FtsB
VKRSRERRNGLRALGRFGVACVALAFVTIVGTQYARIIGRNVALSGELGAAQSDIRALQAREAVDQREIRRLSDPHGAIPEIHDKLHLVSDGEAIIYLKKSHEP